MGFNIVTPDQYRTVPWKNGKGSTLELMVEKCRGEDEFVWRLSMAPVIANGAFSDFAHYDRTLILVEGNGITLNHGNGQCDVLKKKFDMAQFDGGWHTDVVLQAGDILDFNVMTRQGKCRAQVTLLDQNNSHRLSVNADQLLVYALESDVNISPCDSDSFTLPAKHLLCASSMEPGSWILSGEAVICAQIHLV
jgi:environmental stress-induced protein Ves